MDIEVIKVPEGQRKPISKDDLSLGFGRLFTDHMFTMKYAPDKGWHDARIEPHHALELDPACMVLHYSQEAFEGLKAYHGPDGGVYLFRHMMNLQRLNRSCRRLVIPELPLDFVSDALKQLVLVDKEWIPHTEGCSLYIRPNVIATDPYLGVRPSDTYLFYIIMSPVAAYYPEGFNPVKIWVSDDYVRAAFGGVGEAKTGGNYAAGLKAQTEAKKSGFTQVLWLDAKERKYIEEVGTMNIFFIFDDELVTSPLTGSILPGVTRDSVLKIGKHWGMTVNERMISIDEVMEGAKSGRLKECFGSGTAAIISPVKAIKYKDELVTVGNGGTGPIAQKLYDHILGLQLGKVADPFDWVVRLDA
ncbi:MAG: branched-chain amino acid aminotransferase [Deltaproteobacteria bacterium]|nr:branched-chain amino acid aminotransferase [Deltaproteobacteria bacterium]